MATRNECSSYHMKGAPKVQQQEPREQQLMRPTTAGGTTLVKAHKSVIKGMFLLSFEDR